MKNIEALRYEALNDGGYKVIEVNISDPTENLFAVCTPVKK